MKPLIGVSGRRHPAWRLEAVAPAFAGAEIDVHFTEYTAAVARAGGVPVQLSRDADPAAVVDHLDGLLLSGGADVDPRRYGRRPGPHLGTLEPDRDRFELGLVTAALARGLPVLGVCRGAQVLNVAKGGTLAAHLAPDEGEGHSARVYPRAERRHRVRFRPGSLLARLYGAQAMVNSFHHQAVEAPGAGVEPSAWADDGVIEGIELRGADVLGVQWHPEALEHEPVFPWLVERAAALRCAPR